MKLEVVVSDNPVIISNGLEKTTATERRQGIPAPFPMGRLCCALSGTVVSRFHRRGDTAVMSSFVLSLISPSSNHFGSLFVVLVLEGRRESKYVWHNEIMVRSMT
jgi:hypothetical protein